MPLKSLYNLSAEEFEKEIQRLGQPKYRANQILEWVYKKKVGEFDELANVPKNLRGLLKENFQLHTLRLENEAFSENQESQKFLFRTHDDQLLESVLIVQNDRRTVCVSTQLGCKVGCTFCASGKGPFGRNLTSGEIIEQILHIERMMQKPVTNIVYMGMGEPLDNFEATMQSLQTLQADWGLALGSRRITVSSSGITPKIVGFVKRYEGRVRLSISLHSSQEEKRNELVPINKRYSLKELIATLASIQETLTREITFEYTLIKNENDSLAEAEGVGRIAKNLNAKVNIIPYNPIEEMSYERPSPEAIKQFKEILERYGVRVMVRQTAGRDIDAACGQLRLNRR